MAIWFIFGLGVLALLYVGACKWSDAELDRLTAEAKAASEKAAAEARDGVTDAIDAVKRDAA